MPGTVNVPSPMNAAKVPSKEKFCRMLVTGVVSLDTGVELSVNVFTIAPEVRKSPSRVDDLAQKSV